MLFKSTYFRTISTFSAICTAQLWGSHPARFGDRVRVSYLLLACDYVLESDVPILQYTQSFKWPQQIQGSKYRVLIKPTGNYGGRIQPALGTEFVYPIYYCQVKSVLESDVPILQYTQSFKWPQQIPGSKYQILN